MSKAYPFYAFYSLETKLLGRKPTETLASIRRRLNEKDDSLHASPLFITWDIQIHTDTHELRGCIGTFSDVPLDSGIRDYAVVAALEDTRFSPISINELEYLKVSVTILRDFEPVADPLDWQVGTHGIKLEFKKNGIRYNATFLPQVALEQNWDQIQTLRHLVVKAGYSGERLSLDDLHVTRYRGLKYQADYSEYRDFKSEHGI